jgi:protein-serine/threonine kinase
MYFDRLRQLRAYKEARMGYIQRNASVDRLSRCLSLTVLVHSLDYAGPEILRGERYHGREQDVWAFGVVAYVLLVGECPFMSAEESQEGLESPFANASIALDERCAEGKENEGEAADGGGALCDAAALVRACLRVDVTARPTFDKILQCRFLAGAGGWAIEDE